MKKKHIGLRLGASFAVLIVILLGIARIGLRMHEIDKTLADTTGRQSANLDLARRALMLSNINSRIAMEIVLVENRTLVETLLATRSENSKEITRLMEESERRCELDEERKLLDAVKTTRKPYVESYLRAIHLLVDERKHDEAEAVMVNETLPAVLKYHAAWESFMDFQKHEVDVATQQAQIKYATSRHLALLLIGLAVFVAIVIAIFATHETAREIAARIAAKNEVSSLNATLEARVNQRTHDLHEASKRLELQSAALEAAANAIVITDIHGTIIWVNPAFTTMTGYSGEEALGKNARLLKSGEQPEGYYAKLWATISSGNVWQGEIVNRRKDGTTYPEEMTITPVTHGVGDSVETQFVAIKQDITERRRAQDAMAESEMRYRSLFDSNPLPTWVFARKSLKFLAVNEAAIRHYGFSRPEFLAMTIADIRPEAEIPVLLEDIAKRIHGPQEATTWKYQKKDGTIIEVEIVAHDMVFQGIDAELVAVHDVTQRKDAERATNLLAAIVNSSDEAIISKGLDGIISSWNKSAVRLFGYTAEETIGRHISLIIPADRPDEEAWILSQLKRLGQVEHFETVRVCKDRTLIDVSVTVSPIRDGTGHIVGASKLARSITERKEAERALRQAEEKYRAIFEAAVVGIFRSTTAGQYIDVNPSMARMLGYDSPHEMIASITDISRQLYVDPNRREELKRLLGERAMVKNFEYAAFRKDGSKMWFSANIRAVSENGTVVGYEGTNEDITDRKVAEEQVQYLAYYDSLTGLPNRTLVRDRLTKALADARRQKYKIALLFLDLDRFKDINDSLGHSVGDLFLKEVAERLKRFAREQDTVARLGGDEFLIMLTHIKDISDAAVAAERLMDAMIAEFVIQEHSLHVSCSVGISISPEHGVDCETLIKNADAAMYSTKDSGRNNFRFFSAEMNAQVVERLTLESSLRLALDRKQLFLVYQPQMDMASGRITGLEVLLRWQHPELGLVPPDRFIRIAENAGLIVPIGEWVLRTACAQAQKWQNEGLPAVPVAVNVSAVQFRQVGFCEYIRRVLHETGLAPQYLELELTEGLLLANADVTLSVLTELKSMGLTLAIDDFGTGYSSFSYLRQFQISKLKIDRLFIRDVILNPNDAAITTAIIGMARNLNIKVIAEGVENEAQMSFLRAHQCDEIQGYYFSKPLGVEKVANKLRDNTRESHVRAHSSGGQS